MLPLSSHWTLQKRLPRTSPEETNVQGEIRQRHWTSSFWRLNSFPRNPHHTFQLSHDEGEACFMLHEPGKAIIDTGCGRCVIGALTLEAHRSVMGYLANKIVWHYDTPSVVFYYGNGTKIEALVSLIFLVWLVVKTCRFKCMSFQEKFLVC